MGIDETIDLTDDQRKTILALLERHLPGTEAWVYGSRAKWMARPQSDLDLVVFPTSEQHWQVRDIREAFEESNLPFRVDLFVWDEVPESFRKQIESEHAVLVRGRNRVHDSGELDQHTRRFGDLFSAPPRNGLTRPRAVRGVGTKMVNMGELFAHARLDNVQMDRVPLSQSEEERFLLKKGDLLFARQSLVLEGAGKCAIFLGDDEPVTFESHVIRVRLDQRVANPEYYFYYLQSHHGRSAIRAIVEQGAGASGIRGGDLLTLDVLWRPLPEQRAIAQVLGMLDDKIALNRRIDETLEAMARALFKSWFVDFDPVRAKMQGVDTGLPPDIANLFPDRLVESDMGKIPQGWEVSTLGTLIDLLYGKALRAQARRQTGNVPVYGSNGQIGWHDEALVNGPGIVVGRKGNPGRVTLVREDSFFPIDTTFYVVPKMECPSVYYLFFALENQDLARMAADSAVPGLNRNLAYMNKQLVPLPAIVGRFQDIASTLLARGRALAAEARVLLASRDTLLPKLVSGETRLPAAVIDRYVGHEVRAES